MSLVQAEMVMGMPIIVGAHTSDEVQLALDWAADSIESYCERQFAWMSSDTVFVDPFRGNGGKAQAMLPNPPVTNVSTVMALMPINGGLTWTELLYYGWAGDGLLFDTTRFYGYQGVTGSSFWSGVTNADGGFDYDNVPSWPMLPRSLQVTYDHGYAIPFTPAPSNAPALPDGIVKAVIRGAAFFLDNPTGAIEGRVGEITNRFAEQTGSPAGWLDEKLLGQFRMVYL